MTMMTMRRRATRSESCWAVNYELSIAMCHVRQAPR